MDEECRSDECCSEVNIDLETVSSNIADLEDKRGKEAEGSYMEFVLVYVVSVSRGKLGSC